MAILLSTIKPENLVAKHTSGAIAFPSEVKNIGDGKFQYTLTRNWTAADQGEWEIWLDEQSRVLDEAGNAIPIQKISQFTVNLVQTTAYIIIVSWEGAGNQIVRASTPPTDTPGWLEWIESNRNWATMKHRKALWVRFENDLAEEIWAKESDIDPPTHGNADRVGDYFNNVLPQDILIKYQARLNLQNEQLMEMYFPAGKVKRVEFETLDAGSRRLGFGGVDINATAKSFTQAVFCGDSSVVFVRWNILYTDNSTYSYIIAVARQ